MSYLRTILGRFARLLLRIARKLDSSVVSTPDVAFTQRMAALRMRYAGAPAHWLEAVARRAVLADGPGPAPPPPSEPPLNDRAISAKARPAPSFPHRAASRRRPLHFSPSKNEPPVFPRQPLPSRLQHSRPPLVFHDGPRLTALTDPPPVEGRADRDRELHFFSDLNDRAPQAEPASAERRPAERESSNRRRPQFEELARPARPEPEWSDDRDGRHRSDPHFAEPLNRWPDLPGLDELGPDGDVGRLLARYEAAILAEQTEGTWSE